MTAPATTVKVGDRLANGAIVLQVKGSEGYPSSIIVLALSRGEFVTWVGRPDGTDTYWGHYHDTDLTRAMVDFEARR